MLAIIKLNPDWLHFVLCDKELSWSWSYGSCIYNYLCHHCISPLMLWVQIPLRRGLLDAKLCNKCYQWLAVCQWFSPGTPVSSINKIDRCDIAEILLKVALNTITLTLICDIIEKNTQKYRLMNYTIGMKILMLKGKFKVHFKEILCWWFKQIYFY